MRPSAFRLFILLAMLPAPAQCFASEPSHASILDNTIYDEMFFEEVLDPIHHTHFSHDGTPFLHPFSFEPPQIHQDAFFIYKYTKNSLEGSNEYEAEGHIDWALTKRLGFVFAVPMVGVHQQDGTQSVGMGDLEIAPRIMWVEHENFIMASNLFLTVPTGDETRDLGSGETVFSPFLTTWHDLGGWNTLVVNLGPEIGLSSGDVSMIYGFSLAHAWHGPQLLRDEAHVHESENTHEHEQEHFRAGMTALYIEFNGETQLYGDKYTFLEVMPGISYVAAEHAELRFGVHLPVSKRQRFDAQYFSSFTWIY